MNKTTTHKDSLDDVCADLPLEDHELDSVSGGAPATTRPTGGGPMGTLNQIMQMVQQQ